MGAQGWNINRQVPGVEPGSTVRSLVVLWMTVRGLEPLPVLEYRVFPFGTLLGPETTGPIELTIFMVGGDTGSCCF